MVSIFIILVTEDKKPNDKTPNRKIFQHLGILYLIIKTHLYASFEY